VVGTAVVVGTTLVVDVVVVDDVDDVLVDARTVVVERTSTCCDGPPHAAAPRHSDAMPATTTDRLSHPVICTEITLEDERMGKHRESPAGGAIVGKCQVQAGSGTTTASANT
jgi:hypothetical protein